MLGSAPRPQKEVADFLRAQIEDIDKINMEDLVETALSHFESDVDFLRRYFRFAARVSIHEQARALLKWMPDVEMAPPKDSDPADAPVSVFARSWLGLRTGEHFRLGEISKEELQLVIIERQSRVATEQKTIKFLKVIEKELDPGEVVSSRFTEELLAQLAAKHGYRP